MGVAAIPSDAFDAKSLIAAADRALAANPDHYLALVVRGRACAAQGRMQEVVDCLRRSLAIVPEATIHSSLLFDITCLAETTPAKARFAALLAASAA